MLLKKAFDRIEKLDRDSNVTNLSIEGFDVWPILRQCLWKSLNSSGLEKTIRFKKQKSLLLTKIRYLLYNLKYFQWKRFSENNKITSIFISNPVHLQRLRNKETFDKIVDPLIILLDNPNCYEKFYISPFQFKNNLSVKGKFLFPFIYDRLYLSEEIEKNIKNIAILADVEPSTLVHEFKLALDIFYKWYLYGKKLFNKRSSLKRLFIVGWYSPAIMGLVAAARIKGVISIDIQHGKQGQYQAMYNGWNESRINSGYDQMPDYFWTWGEPTKRHILAGCNRTKHIPIVGGYPWIEHYIKFECKKKSEAKKQNYNSFHYAAGARG